MDKCHSYNHILLSLKATYGNNVDLGTTASSIGVKVTHNTMINSFNSGAEGYGITVPNGGEDLIDGNIISKMYLSGIRVDSPNCTISNNILIDNGQIGSGGDQAGIHLTYLSQPKSGGHNILGNTASDDQITPTQTYGLLVDVGINLPCNINDNDFSRSPTAVGGGSSLTGFRFNNNPGFITEYAGSFTNAYFNELMPHHLSRTPTSIIVQSTNTTALISAEGYSPDGTNFNLRLTDFTGTPVSGQSGYFVAYYQP